MEWKTIATVLFVILVIENAFMLYGYVLLEQEEENTLTCYYDICGSYVDADFYIDTNVCTCYEYDLLGKLIVAKTERLK